MRTRFISLLALGAFLCVSPLTLTAQAGPSLKLTTSSTQAESEFRAGMVDRENLSAEAAAAHFDAAVKADPAFGLARVLYAITSPSLNRDQKIAELNHGVADAARGSLNELILAATYRESFLNHPAAAATLVRASTELMPSDRFLAFAAAQMASRDHPLEGLREFTSRYPDYAPAFNTLAYQLWQAGDHAGALAAAKRQAELNGKAPNPHDSYAELLQFNGDFAAAAAHYKEAASMSPRFPEAYAGLAEIASLQGNYDQARSYLNQAIANAWGPQEKLDYMRAILGTYTLQGSAADASRQLAAIAAEAKAQNDPEAEAITYAQIATSYGAAGKAAESHRYLAMAKAASSTEPWQVHYFGTMAHALMKHWGPANEELNALKSMSSTDPTVRTRIAAAEGFMLTQQGKPADALKVLMAADTTNDLVINRIAEAHAALGHPAEAAAWDRRITSNYQLNLANFPEINSRRRATVYLSSKPR